MQLYRFRKDIADQVSDVPFVKEMWKDGNLVAISSSMSLEVLVTATGTIFQVPKSRGRCSFKELDVTWWTHHHRDWWEAVNLFCQGCLPGSFNTVSKACLAAKVVELYDWKLTKENMNEDERLACLKKGFGLWLESVIHRADLKDADAVPAYLKWAWLREATRLAVGCQSLLSKMGAADLKRSLDSESNTHVERRKAILRQFNLEEWNDPCDFPQETTNSESLEY